MSRVESEDLPPVRFYVEHENKELIEAVKKEHGDSWQDFTDRDDIIARRNFRTRKEAVAFMHRMQKDGFFAAVYERKALHWIDDLRYWEWEGEVIAD